MSTDFAGAQGPVEEQGRTQLTQFHGVPQIREALSPNLPSLSFEIRQQRIVREQALLAPNGVEDLLFRDADLRTRQHPLVFTLRGRDIGDQVALVASAQQPTLAKTAPPQPFCLLLGR